MRFAEERARAGRYRESALLFDRAIAQGTVPYEVWEWAALTHLAAGDEEGYRRTCAVMRSRYPASLAESEVERLLGRVCTWGPGGLGDDGKALGWATGTPGPASARTAGVRSRFLALLGAVQLPVGTILRGDRVDPPGDRRGRWAGIPGRCRLPGDGPIPLGRSARCTGDAGPMPAAPRPGRRCRQPAADDGRSTPPRGRATPLRRAATRGRLRTLSRDRIAEPCQGETWLRPRPAPPGGCSVDAGGLRRSPR